MTFDDINIRVVISTIHKMELQFRSKDLSEHDDMTSAHSKFLSEYQYHSVVARVLGILSRKPDRPVRMVETPKHERGELWSKRGAESESGVSETTPTEED